MDKNTNTPDPPAEIPEPPEHLDQEARAEWNRITPLLHSMGILATADRAALALYCSHWSAWIEAEIKVREKGPVVLSGNGTPVENPYLKISARSAEAIRKLLPELGLSPSARTRVHVLNSPFPGVSTRQRKQAEHFGGLKLS